MWKDGRIRILILIKRKLHKKNKKMRSEEIKHQIMKEKMKKEIKISVDHLYLPIG